jgi:predicted nucleotidyltransferase
MNKRGSDVNESDLDKNNIIKPTFDTLTEEDHKALEAYHAEVYEVSYSCYEVMWQGLDLMETTSIIIHKAEVTPEV